MNQPSLYASLFGLFICSCTSRETPHSEGSGGTNEEGSGGTYHVIDGGSGGGGTTGSESSGLTVCRLGGVETRPTAGKGTLIDNFDDGDVEHTGNGTIGYWIGNDDGTSGHQVPPSPGPEDPYARLPEASTSKGGVEDNGYALHVVGSGYSTWGSTIGVLLAAKGEKLAEQCAFDATEYDGISFWLRGEVISETSDTPGIVTVQVLESDIVPQEQGGECDALNSSCWDAHATKIAPTACWRLVSIPFSELAPAGWGLPPGELSLDALSAITFVTAQNMRYDYWIDELRFYSGSPQNEREDCTGMGGMGGSDFSR